MNNPRHEFAFYPANARGGSYRRERKSFTAALNSRRRFEAGGVARLRQEDVPGAEGLLRDPARDLR